VREQLQADPLRTLQSVRQIGFGEVETAGFAGLAAQRFRELLDAAGLKCPSAHLQFAPGAFERAFEQAHALGAHYAASGSLRELVASAAAAPPPSATAATRGMTLDEARRTAELANRIGEQAQRAGLQYVYHNHDFEFSAQPGGIGYDLLLEETDPALVQFEIDCGWMVLGGRDPRSYFARHLGRFPLIHVKDFLPTAAEQRAEHPGAELGHGMIDYGPIFAVAERAGLQHYFAEQEGPFAHLSQLDAARQAYAYLRKLR
jgi:sugar phosphate isomerase/epimerase